MTPKGTFRILVLVSRPDKREALLKLISYIQKAYTAEIEELDLASLKRALIGPDFHASFISKSHSEQVQLVQEVQLVRQVMTP